MNEQLGVETVKNLTWKTYLWMMCLSLLISSADATVIVIDDFEDGTVALQATNTSRYVEFNQQATPSAIGGYRNGRVVLKSEYLSAAANSNPIPGVMAFSSGSQSLAEFVLRYAGKDYEGLKGIDLSDGGTNQVINVDFTSADFGAQTSIILFDIDEHYARIEQDLSSGSSVVSFKLSEFATEGVDVTAIDVIDFIIDGEESGDYVIDGIYATVPEPGTIAIWDLLGVGMAFYIRRKRV